MYIPYISKNLLRIVSKGVLNLCCEKCLEGRKKSQCEKFALALAQVLIELPLGLQCQLGRHCHEINVRHTVRE